MNEHNIPLIQSDAVLFGILAAILGLVFGLISIKLNFGRSFMELFRHYYCVISFHLY